MLQEIFKDAFRPYEALRDLSVILFRWSALVVLLVGVMWAINGNHKSDNGAIVDAILLAERSVRLMQCGLVFFLLLFSEYLGISRRSPLFGISLGFGLFAAVNMLVATGYDSPWNPAPIDLASHQQRGLSGSCRDLVGLHPGGRFLEKQSCGSRGAIERSGIRRWRMLAYSPEQTACSTPWIARLNGCSIPVKNRRSISQPGTVRNCVGLNPAVPAAFFVLPFAKESFQFLYRSFRFAGGIEER